MECARGRSADRRDRGAGVGDNRNGRQIILAVPACDKAGRTQDFPAVGIGDVEGETAIGVPQVCSIHPLAHDPHRTDWRVVLTNSIGDQFCRRAFAAPLGWSGADSRRKRYPRARLCQSGRGMNRPGGRRTQVVRQRRSFATPVAMSLPGLSLLRRRGAGPCRKISRCPQRRLGCQRYRVRRLIRCS